MRYVPALLLVPLLACTGLAGCSDRPEAPPPPQVGAPPGAAPATPAADAQVEADSNRDVHSFAQPQQIATRHLTLDLTVDFDRQVLAGTATLDLERRDDSETLVLDTRDLVIESVQAGSDAALAEVPFTLGDRDDILGTPLSITLPANADRVAVTYRTVPGASGLQWLTPRQTAGKQHPFLFSQAQAIHARSFVPVQDTPAVRFTYEATVRVPPGLRAVMSADNSPELATDGVYRFRMPQPIPSYLLAIAAGDLDFQAMGERTGVYAEPSLLAAAAEEFADTERMLEIAEQEYGPYRWGRYDLLILPPSFPFGGMENPRLSFITPTVIAGDRSLVALIAHELAHSWSGNLVTNASWRDLWLNEGFTTYLTNRIMQQVYGDRRYRMEMALGLATLEEAIDQLPAPDERLVPDVQGRDPDVVFSEIPYQKGALLLYEIEQRVGREAFDAFLLDYFDRFQFQSLTTEAFLAHLEQTLAAAHPEAVDLARVRSWIYEPGIPDGAPAPTSDAFARIHPVRDAWLAGDVAAADIDTADWTFHEWKYFLDGMPSQLADAQLAALDEAFRLTEAGNNEIAFSWLRIAIRNDYAPANDRLEDFLVQIGRNKFVSPLYRGLVDAGRREDAQRIFELARPGYHPLTVKLNSAIVYERPN
jgi:leukotriene A-4 hydrolase/aminopeptidase